MCEEPINPSGLTIGVPGGPQREDPDTNKFMSASLNFAYQHPASGHGGPLRLSQSMSLEGTDPNLGPGVGTSQRYGH